MQQGQRTGQVLDASAAAGAVLKAHCVADLAGKEVGRGNTYGSATAACAYRLGI